MTEDKLVEKIYDENYQYLYSIFSIYSKIARLSITFYDVFQF